MVHDPTSGKLLLFGGQFQSSQSMVESYNDLWSYTPGANTWTQLNPSGVLPAPRGFASMAYDPDQKVILLYGGVGLTTPFRSDMPSVSNLTDLWAYGPSANTWTKETPDGASPPFRMGGAITYDRSAQKLLLFGGRVFGSPNDTDLNDLWEYDLGSATWTELHPSGDIPGAREGAVLAYDPNTERTFLYGGFVPAEVKGPDGSKAPGEKSSRELWAYDSRTNRWTRVHPKGAQPSEAGTFFYDPIISRFLVVAPVDKDNELFLSDVWSYDPVTNTGAKIPLAGPIAPSRDQVLALAPESGQVLAYGGASPSSIPGGSGDLQYYEDSWVLSLSP
jgi:hypothetical protein